MLSQQRQWDDKGTGYIETKMIDLPLDKLLTRPESIGTFLKREKQQEEAGSTESGNLRFSDEDSEEDEHRNSIDVVGDDDDTKTTDSEKLKSEEEKNGEHKSKCEVLKTKSEENTKQEEDSEEKDDLDKFFEASLPLIGKQKNCHLLVGLFSMMNLSNSFEKSS